MKVVLWGNKHLFQMCSSISHLISVLHNFDADFGFTKCYVSGENVNQIQQIANDMFGLERHYVVKPLQNGTLITFVA